MPSGTLAKTVTLPEVNSPPQWSSITYPHVTSWFDCTVKASFIPSFFGVKTLGTTTPKGSILNLKLVLLQP